MSVVPPIGSDTEAEAVLATFLWLIWKLKWVILGNIGLEDFFGSHDDQL